MKNKDKKVVSWKLSDSSPEFCSLNDENFGEEDNVQDYDNDDWNSEKPIAVTQIHPAMVILDVLTVESVGSVSSPRDKSGRHNTE